MNERELLSHERQMWGSVADTTVSAALLRFYKAAKPLACCATASSTDIMDSLITALRCSHMFITVV